MPALLRCVLLTAALLLPVPCADAQSTGGGTSAATPAPPAVSGLLFGNYHYLVGGADEDFNQFVLDRAYLTVRGAPAARTSFRLTSDVYRSGDGNGWTVRLKYGYLDYALRAAQPFATTLRAGMLQTVAIEHVESFWPRWLGPVAIDRHGYMSSADVGVASQVALPRRMGEVYVHVVNGTSYTRRETDRFKDFGGRLSLTPLAARTTGLLRSLTLTGWVYEGATGSRFAADTARPVGEGLRRDRAGIFAGIRDPRLTLGLEHARRSEDVERGGNSVLDPRTVAPADGAITSGFAVVRPLAWLSGKPTSPVGLVARYDHVTRDDGRRNDSHYLFAGALYDVNDRLAVALDYQEQLASSSPATPGFRGWFANFAVNF